VFHHVSCAPWRRRQQQQQQSTARNAQCEWLAHAARSVFMRSRCSQNSARKSSVAMARMPVKAVLFMQVKKMSRLNETSSVLERCLARVTTVTQKNALHALLQNRIVGITLRCLRAHVTCHTQTCKRRGRVCAGGGDHTIRLTVWDLRGFFLLDPNPCELKVSENTHAQRNKPSST
jgi:hypothetical protein